MSIKPNAPYTDRVSDDGMTIFYEGHDVLGDKSKVHDQPMALPSGVMTQNGMFCNAIDQAKKHRDHKMIDIEQTRQIPGSVKQKVFMRDKGQCVQCGSRDNLHFDHILPYAKGGTSLKEENIRLLCARHNLEKSAKLDSF